MLHVFKLRTNRKAVFLVPVKKKCCKKYIRKIPLKIKTSALFYEGQNVNNKCPAIYPRLSITQSV